ncbi:DNA ligase [Perkinsela sp. CCAP 1560/4]|nr:DNA ligase [Perkinsela sp. CCAP 1560/4]|eukprot:KNH05117.1 DNA ligase [Perkinsela sp. CCAP 1560/4]
MNMTGQASRVAAMSFTKLQPEAVRMMFRKGPGKPFYAMPKVDGVRCLATTNGLYTKNGHPINALFHIQQNVFKVLYREYRDFDPHAVVLDGELYADRETSVGELSGVIRSHPFHLNIDEFRKQQKVKYHVFDVYFLQQGVKNMPFDERQVHLKKILHNAANGRLQHIIHVKGSAFRDWMQYENILEKFVKQGTDGIVVYHPKGVYEQRKRSKKVWKFLPRHVAWFPICGIRKGPRRILFVECLNPKRHRFTIGNPLDAKTRKALLSEKQVDRLQVKVQFYKLTPAGIPRFASIIGCRRKSGK